MQYSDIDDGTTDAMKLEITHDEGSGVFRTEVHGDDAYLRYRHRDPNTLEYHYVYVPPSQRGLGIASAIVKEALDYAQLNSYLVDPTCGFVAAYMDAHTEFDGLRARD